MFGKNFGKNRETNVLKTIDFLEIIDIITIKNRRKREVMQDLIEGLNERQKEAVLETEGPCLVIAGAGSRKNKSINT